MGNIMGNIMIKVRSNIVGNTMSNIAGSIMGNIMGNIVGNIMSNIMSNIVGNLMSNIMGSSIIVDSYGKSIRQMAQCCFPFEPFEPFEVALRGYDFCSFSSDCRTAELSIC